jgi:hypothetical protein
VFVRRIEIAALAALVIATVPAVARADGAFPSGEVVLVPVGQPQRIVLVTNFGVVLSDDGGQSWSWSCERDENALAVLYQFGPAPRHRLFAVANAHVIYSDDASCSWNVAGGLVADQVVTDVFPDPTNADRVLAVAVSGASHAVFESTDGGGTFGTMLYRASGGDAVNGVEVARSDPRVAYVALTSPERSPKLARTADGGAQWDVRDLSTGLGSGFVRIIAVDPVDPNNVLLRWLGATGGEAIGVTRDGGATVTKPLSIATTFNSFARMPNGALVVSGTAFVNQRTIAALFVSRDGGGSFEENISVPGVLALAQRGGILYAATDNFVDGYALGASSDEGATWQPVVRFDQIGSIMPCLRTNPQCQSTCLALAGVGFGSPGTIWSEAVCTGAAGTAGTGGRAPRSSGGCAVANPTSHSNAQPRDLGLAVVIALGLFGRRRARHRLGRTTGTIVAQP